MWVILNTDQWLENKGHGHPFYNYDQREEILLAIRYVDNVVPQIGLTDTVAESLKVYRPMIFAKGGDRTMSQLPIEEKTYASSLGIGIITGVGGYEKPNSSRWVIEKMRENK
jgi:glycerol-3-phosphate cytidylyltransferase-like family protein